MRRRVHRDCCLLCGVSDIGVSMVRQCGVPYPPPPFTGPFWSFWQAGNPIAQFR